MIEPRGGTQLYGRSRMPVSIPHAGLRSLRKRIAKPKIQQKILRTSQYQFIYKDTKWNMPLDRSCLKR